MWKRGKYWVGLVAAGILLIAVENTYNSGRLPSKNFFHRPVPNTCGPDALAAALAQFKIRVTSSQIAQLAGTDLSGTTMLGLKHAADTLGTKSVGLRLSQRELEAYVNQGAGVIAFVNGNHYVWVKNTRPQGVVIKDAQPELQFVALEKWYPMWFESTDGKTPDPESGRGVCLVIFPGPGPQPPIARN